MIEKIIEEKCVGCEECSLGCPNEIIIFDQEKNKAYLSKSLPEECRTCFWEVVCQGWCPVGAIIHRQLKSNL